VTEEDKTLAKDAEEAASRIIHDIIWLEKQPPVISQSAYAQYKRNKMSAQMANKYNRN